MGAESPRTMAVVALVGVSQCFREPLGIHLMRLQQVAVMAVVQVELVLLFTI